ncbi:MAG: hypothetical protein E7618_01920 [Ruminococcaceae bacterium]|nr:hypothetical protein [Oscillospiraceae bacterium]
MYCVKCGVELADSEKKCPLCQTTVVCPDGMKRENSESRYPPFPGNETEGISRAGALFIVTFLFFIPFALCLLCDLALNHEIVWSGYASGGILLSYILMILPTWFRKPNPVIFVPIDFGAIGLYLLYINLATDGRWFLSLAFPMVVLMALIVTAVVTLTRYTHGGELFIYGGASIAFGGAFILLEFLISLTFDLSGMFHWSPLPFTAMFLLGMMLIVIGICKPLRESLRRKFFF